MPNKVAHFEIYGDDPLRLGQFYQRLFGWKIDKMGGSEGGDYWLIRTVATNDKGEPTEAGGINGGLMKRPTPEARAWMNYVAVESVDATLERARSAGAAVLMPKGSVPNIGWFAVLADPEMNAFGIWQDDPSAR